MVNGPEMAYQRLRVYNAAGQLVLEQMYPVGCSFSHAPWVPMDNVGRIEVELIEPAREPAA